MSNSHKAKLISGYFYWDNQLIKKHLKNLSKSLDKKYYVLAEDFNLLFSYLNAVFLLCQEFNCLGKHKNITYFDTGLKSNNNTRIIGYGIKYINKDIATFRGFLQEQFKELNKLPVAIDLRVKFSSANFPVFNNKLIANFNSNNFPSHLYERLVKEYVYSKYTRKHSKNDRQIYEYKDMNLNDVLYICKRTVSNGLVYKYIKNKKYTYIVESAFPLSEHKNYLGYIVFSYINKKFYAKTYLTMNMVKGYVVFNDLERAKDFSVNKIQENEEKNIKM